MKIYDPQPVDLIRLQITQQKNVTEYLTLCECTAQQVKDHVEKIIVKAQRPVFITGSKTSVSIREAKGGMNGKSRSFSFYGLSPQELKELIIKSLSK